MKTWDHFTKDSPALGAYGAERIRGKVSYLATIRADGAPRVHPVAPFFGQGSLYVYMDPQSPKCRDLLRDARYALHASVEDRDGGEGEFAVSGQARVIQDPARRAEVFGIALGIGFNPKERYIIFELLVQSALSVVYQGDQTVRSIWRDGDMDHLG